MKTKEEKFVRFTFTWGSQQPNTNTVRGEYKEVRKKRKLSTLGSLICAMTYCNTGAFSNVYQTVTISCCVDPGNHVLESTGGRVRHFSEIFACQK